jgi:hypothetical protein
LVEGARSLEICSLDTADGALEAYSLDADEGALALESCSLDTADGALALEAYSLDAEGALALESCSLDTADGALALEAYSLDAEGALALESCSLETADGARALEATSLETDGAKPLEGVIYKEIIVCSFTLYFYTGKSIPLCLVVVVPYLLRVEAQEGVPGTVVLRMHTFIPTLLIVFVLMNLPEPDGGGVV